MWACHCHPERRPYFIYDLLCSPASPCALKDVLNVQNQHVAMQLTPEGAVSTGCYVKMIKRTRRVEQELRWMLTQGVPQGTITGTLLMNTQFTSVTVRVRWKVHVNPWRWSSTLKKKFKKCLLFWLSKSSQIYMSISTFMVNPKLKLSLFLLNFRYCSATYNYSTCDNTYLSKFVFPYCSNLRNI